mgnify:CR=1 FL=1
MASAAPSFDTPRREDRHHSPIGVQVLLGNEPPGRLDIHIHSELEVGLVLVGQEHIHFSAYVARCGPGDVWLCRAWEPHGWRVEQSGKRTIVVMFHAGFLGEELLCGIPWLNLFAVPPSERPQASSAEARRRVLRIGEVILQEVEPSGQPGWETVVRLELLHLLLHLRRGWGAPEPPRAGHVRVADLQRVMPALNLVHSLRRQRVRVADAAAACGFSPSHFHRLFRQTMGISFSQFSLRARLAFAAQRIVQSGRSVTAIAREAGFVDESHLHRHFVRHFGCTPSQYRQRRDGAEAHATDIAKGFSATG